MSNFILNKLIDRKCLIPPFFEPCGSNITMCSSMKDTVIDGQHVCYCMRCAAIHVCKDQCEFSVQTKNDSSVCTLTGRCSSTPFLKNEGNGGEDGDDDDDSHASDMDEDDGSGAEGADEEENEGGKARTARTARSTKKTSRHDQKAEQQTSALAPYLGREKNKKKFSEHYIGVVVDSILEEVGIYPTDEELDELKRKIWEFLTILMAHRFKEYMKKHSITVEGFVQAVLCFLSRRSVFSYRSQVVVFPKLVCLQKYPISRDITSLRKTTVKNMKRKNISKRPIMQTGSANSKVRKKLRLFLLQKEGRIRRIDVTRIFPSTKLAQEDISIPLRTKSHPINQ